MQKDIFDRVLEEGYYIAHTGATVRKTAEVFHFSKSTVHKDVTDRLYRIDKALYEKVKTVLEINLKERHVRGGEATRLKFLKLKNNR
jgi:putative DeoR family transcriptional regulator (stage III sporulation protein D)